MAERKAVNKYYPPDWTPDQGSLNTYHGTHALRERARKLDQGIMIIRFELPYNIWCGGCGNHVGMGVRYNAEKKKVGNYYSTPIYRFKMKCHLCDNRFEIETDPKNCEYVIVSGARRKEERWEPSATETIETTDREDAKKLAEDAMFKLEHGAEDVKKLKAAVPGLEQLRDVQSVWKDDYAANQVLRKKFREEKKELKLEEKKDNELKAKGALDIALLPERAEDVELAKKIRYKNEGFDAHRRKRRLEIKSRPLFDSKDKNKDQRGSLTELLQKRRMMEMPSLLQTPKRNDEEIVTKFGVTNRRRREDATSCEVQTPQPALCEKTRNGDNSTVKPDRDALTNEQTPEISRDLLISRDLHVSGRTNCDRLDASTRDEVACADEGGTRSCQSATVHRDHHPISKSGSVPLSLVLCEYTDSGESSSEQ